MRHVMFFLSLMCGWVCPFLARCDHFLGECGWVWMFATFFWLGVGGCDIFLVGCGWVWVGMIFFGWVWVGVGECNIFLAGCGWVSLFLAGCKWVWSFLDWVWFKCDLFWLGVGRSGWVHHLLRILELGKLLLERQ